MDLLLLATTQALQKIPMSSFGTNTMIKIGYLLKKNQSLKKTLISYSTCAKTYMTRALL